MADSLRMWSVGEDASKVDPVEPLAEIETELEFENILVRNPEMLEPGLRLVGRQTPTAGGWLDLLGIDRDGRLVVYELKRGRLARDAVTQILDYASDLNARSPVDLAEHIAARSGADGIARIDDFEEWYIQRFGGDDLSRLLPPRMVLVGLGVDEAAERMARFVSSGGVDLSVLTFHAFRNGAAKLLARQMEVEPRPSATGTTTAERRQQLKTYLSENGYSELFESVRQDLRRHLPQTGLWEQPGSHGTGFQISTKDNAGRGQSKIYFGVYAGYLTERTFSVSIGQQSCDLASEARDDLKEWVDDLPDWPNGGKHASFTSEEEWTELRGPVLRFVDAVVVALGLGEA